MMHFSAAPNAPKSQETFALMHSQYLHNYKRKKHPSTSKQQYAPDLKCWLIYLQTTVSEPMTRVTCEDEVDKDIEFVYNAQEME